MRRVAFHTLGCRVNQYEEAAMTGLFAASGYEVVPFDRKADVYVIHTCAVTHLAAGKSRNMIRRARRTGGPDAIVAVTGCYPQVSRGEVEALGGVDLIIGTRDKGRIVELVGHVRSTREPVSLVRDPGEALTYGGLKLSEGFEACGRTRAVLKIEDGCDRYCAYCVIPHARGPVRSRPPDSVLAEARMLVDQGFSEIVLTGINLAAYGRDLGEERCLSTMLEALDGMPGLERIRLSSVEPADIDARLLSTVSDLPTVCHHLHLPLQHGSDAILRRMNRAYTAAQYADLAGEARERMPDLGLSTDLMVGFPGEREGDFEEMLRFVRRMAFSRIHVFRYSPRPGTEAAVMEGQVEPEVAGQRSERLRRLAGELARSFHERFLGRRMEVLVEGGDRDRDLLTGHTRNYIRACFPGRGELVNRVVTVVIDEAGPGHVRGRVVD